MVSASKEYVRLIELPFFIREKVGGGFSEFRITILDPTKTKAERVQVRSWRSTHPAKNLVCPDCDKPFNNSNTLLLHERKERHGPFSEPKALYSGAELVS